MRKMPESVNGHPLIATVQLKDTVKPRRSPDSRGTVRTDGADLASYGIFLYSLLDWEIMYPQKKREFNDVTL
jgi:hypothetical protein